MTGFELQTSGTGSMEATTLPTEQQPLLILTITLSCVGEP